MMRTGWRLAGLGMLASLALASGALLAPVPAAAGDTPGRFDYWLLSLSWSPQFCADRPSEAQCSLAYDFVVHGLWPQHQRGFPDFCARKPDDLPPDLITRMLPLMPSSDLIRHQWRKHGTCSGMNAREYFMTVERARRAVVIPPIYREPKRYIVTRLREIEDEFIKVNPRLQPDMLAVQCRGRYLREVRVCFDKQFQPAACGDDVDDRCAGEVVLRPNRFSRSRENNP
jgi:ribonuclease T2